MTTPLDASIRRKVRESAQTQERFFEEHAAALVACAERMASAFDDGARLYTFGNGGSACDAEHLALEFLHPVIEKRPSLPAMALTASQPVLTAIGNDRDFALVFVEQLRTLARPGDIAVGISTSGKAASVVRGLSTARELGLLTIAVTGRDGGKLREACDHCFTVPSFSIHRIQEAHGTLIHLLWDLVHVARGAEDVLG
jgi:D-sedoheptulose 7-phosphate isomerase